MKQEQVTKGLRRYVNHLQVTCKLIAASPNFSLSNPPIPHATVIGRSTDISLTYTLGLTRF